MALVSLALHASGCTSLLGDLPTGQAGDASVADGGGDTMPQETSPGPDVTNDVPTDNGGGTDSGDSGATCGPSNCANGCCNASGQCVPFSSQSSGSCGKGGLACAACAGSDSCSNGACTCGGTACNGCCGTGNTCVSPTTNTQCGANGTACTACASDQECNAQGQCVCDAHTCPSGCCDANQHCVTSTTNTQCGTGGASCQSCGQGQECKAGACTCDATSCPMGCCNGGSTGTCEAYAVQSTTSCGTGGAACGTCSSGSTCSNGACTCGGGACTGCCSNGTCMPSSTTACGLNGTSCQACASDQTCSSAGQCVCDPTKCAGCCDSTTQHCVATATNTQCGSNGSACMTCGTGLECSGGACVCDSTSCSMGCCNGGSTGTCEAYNAQTGQSCGKGGATCSTCPTGLTCDGSTGSCVCNASSCPHGCCSGGLTGTCVDWSAQTPTSCGTAGAACAGCTNGLCDTMNGTCACDSTTCASGCCVGGSTGTCEAYSGQAATSCGTNAATCAACGANESCANGSCTCGNIAACTGGTSCCVVAGTGSCVNFQNDPNNCGWCGHSCQGGTCSSGICSTITIGQTTYASMISNAGGITLDGAGNVYFSEYVSNNANGYIEKCPITGCPGTPPTATAIFTVPGNASGLGQIIYDPSSTYLYFADEGQAHEYAITTAGASILQLTADSAVEGVATDSTYYYFADGQGLAYVNKLTGGSLNRITSLLGYTFAVAVDPNTGNLWGAATDSNEVASCTRAGACSTWTWTNYPRFLAVVGTTPYVMGLSSGFYRCASDSDCTQANATQLMTQGATFANFSYDANYAYFGSTALLQRCSLATGCGATGQNVAQAAGNIVWTANDATWVYWITSNGYIQKVPK